MIVESPDLLKQWLTGYLAPLCDADPEALAKYCLALVRKDRPVSELKASMVEQLDVFLQSNTKPFVDKFLQVTTSRSYIPKRLAPSSSSSSSSSTSFNLDSTSDSGIPPLPPTPSNKQSSGHSPDSTTPPNNVPQPPVPSSTSTTLPTPPLPPPTSTTAPPPPPPPEAVPPPPPPASVIIRKEEVTSSQRLRKPDSDRDRDDRRGRRRSPSRIRSRSRSRSGSRSRDRSRRSRSRGRNGRSKYEDRRRRSPLSKRYRRSRTRSRTRSPRRSRSPRCSRSRERKSRSRNRSRSPSPRSRPLVRGRSPAILPRSPSPSRNKSLPRDEPRESPPRTSPVADAKIEPRNDSSAMIQSVVAKHTEFPPPPATKKQRCRDYDEKGYCMRGDMCSFDHGSDPVVLEGISGMLDYPPPPVPPGPPGAPGYTPAPAPTQGVPRPRPPLPRHPHFAEYTPRDPSMWGSQPDPVPGTYYGSGPDRGPTSLTHRFSAPPPPLPPNTPRELINVPVNNGNHIVGGGGVGPSLARRLGPVVSAGGHSMSVAAKGIRQDLESCTLELRKIPPGLNTIAHLNDHFSKFGTVVNIQVHYEGNPENALVTFNSHSEANAAYRSTEAVLNNRFIKLFWHNPQNKNDRTVSYSTQPLRPVHDRLGVRHPNKTLNKTVVETPVDDKNEKVMMSRGSLVKTVYNTQALQSAAAVSAINTPSYPAAAAVAVAGNTAGTGAPPSPGCGPHPLPAAPGAVTPTSPLAGSPSVPAVAPEFSHSTTSPSDTKRQEIDAIMKQRELLAAEVAAKHKVEKQKADAMKLKSEVEQRKRQLLDKQMQQLKVLLKRAETNKATMKPDEKKQLLETIKSLQGAIDSTRSELSSVETPKSKAQLDKEILDTELELYAVQAESGDASKLKLRLSHLRAQQQAAGYPPTRPYRHCPYSTRGGLYGGGRGRGVGRGGVRGRGRAGRGYSHSFASVDRRTTKINASGFEREDKDEVLAHFATLGKITNYVWDGQTPAITIQYSTRREAEKAMNEGRTLGDRLLTLTWAFDAALPITTQLPTSVPTPSSSQQPQLSPHSYANVTPHSTTALLSPDETLEEITEEIVEEVETEEGDQPVLFEEEEEEVEEEEEEVRSWRR